MLQCTAFWEYLILAGWGRLISGGGNYFPRRCIAGGALFGGEWGKTSVLFEKRFFVLVWGGVRQQPEQLAVLVTPLSLVTASITT